MNNNPVKIAVPLQNGKVSGHFGHPDFFSLLSVDSSSKQILGEALRSPPPHEPGRLPLWLAEQGVNVVLASGIGHRAVVLLESQGIEVQTGVPLLSTSEVVQLWLDGKLETGGNTCSHTSSDHRCGGHD
jgi:ATP-binding protein involved in chromosome partitioning